MFQIKNLMIIHRRRIVGQELLHLRNCFAAAARRGQCHFLILGFSSWNVAQDLLILGFSSWNVAQDLLSKRNKKFLIVNVQMTKQSLT